MATEATPKRPVLSKEEISRGRFAWPTIALALVSALVFSKVVWAYSHGELSVSATVCINFVAAFVSFTPMHDAVHGSVSKNRFVNDLVGRMSGFVIFAPMEFFRYIHGQHHKYNNHPELDPDHWASLGPTVLLPLRWATVFVFYMHYARHRAAHELRVNGKLSVGLRKGLMSLAYFIAAAFAFGAAIGPNALLVAWLAPAGLAMSVLMWLFDYVPHRPHAVSDRVNPYAATNITSGLLSVQELTLPMLGQNYHLIHHLWPHLPFYAYSDVYWRRAAEFKAKGAKTIPLLDLRGVQFKNHEN